MSKDNDKNTAPHEEVLTEMWKLVDTAQALSQGLFDDLNDARMSLADRLKMLNRALLVFHDVDLDETLESNPERHWHMKELRDRERERVRKILENDE